MALPTLDDVVVETPRHPYNRQDMVHDVKVRIPSGGYRTIKRPVYPYIDFAMANRGDYWHPGGDIIDSRGNKIGYRKDAGWFIHGYKWQDESPNFEGVPYLAPEE